MKILEASSGGIKQSTEFNVPTFGSGQLGVTVPFYRKYITFDTTTDYRYVRDCFRQLEDQED